MILLHEFKRESKLSIPLSEITKFTNNPELQKNIQAWSEVLGTVQKNLNTFFNNPEVQQSLATLNKMVVNLHNYLNDPVVQNNIQSFQKSLVDIVNTQDFQNKFNEKSRVEKTFTEDLQIFEDLISQEIDVNDYFSDTSTLDPKSKLEIIWKTLEVVLVIYSLYFAHLDQFNDYKEAYVFYINDIESKAVSTASVNLREAPDLNSESKLVIPQNSLFKVYEGDNNGWVKVSININGLDEDGYVFKDHIKYLR